MSSTKTDRVLYFAVAFIWILLGSLLTVFSVASCVFFSFPEQVGTCELTVPSIALVSTFPFLVIGILGIVLGALSLVWKRKREVS